MNGLTDFVARLKAWQVFALLVFPVFASQVYMMSNMPVPAITTSTPRPPSVEEFAVLFRQMMLVTLIWSVLLLGWLLSVGLATNRRVERGIRLNTRMAIGCALFAVSYIALIPYVWPIPGQSESGGVSMGLFVLLHFLAMFGIFYVLAFAARNVLMAERQTNVSFFDYSGPFFLMWFFPIGIWFVQPRVNRLVSDHQQHH